MSRGAGAAADPRVALSRRFPRVLAPLRSLSDAAFAPARKAPKPQIRQTPLRALRNGLGGWTRQPSLLESTHVHRRSDRILTACDLRRARRAGFGRRRAVDEANGLNPAWLLMRSGPEFDCAVRAVFVDAHPLAFLPSVGRNACRARCAASPSWASWLREVAERPRSFRRTAAGPRKAIDLQRTPALRGSGPSGPSVFDRKLGIPALPSLRSVQSR
jgi:hypothetical protein